MCLYAACKKIQKNANDKQRYLEREQKISLPLDDYINDKNNNLLNFFCSLNDESENKRFNGGKA